MIPTESRPYARAFVDYARDRPEVVCITGDLTQPCEVDGFRDAYPERFINAGMAEQNMIGIASGLAREGLLPCVHSFGVFLTRRALDQISMAIAYPRVRVRLMGFLPGITSPGGVTHQAIDDLAIMCALPNMTVLDLADVSEIRAVHSVLDRVDGPAYCRVLRGDVPACFDTPPVLGKLRRLSSGGDVCVVSSSIATGEAMRAVSALKRRGVSVCHLHAWTLKPFDDPDLPAALESAGGVVTVENHLVAGGLGTAVAETMVRHRIARPFAKLGLQDTYAVGGTQLYLMKRFGLSAEHIIRAVDEVLGA